MIGGIAVVGDNSRMGEELRFWQNAVGAISGPFDSFLALRGLKTLALRMQRHCENAPGPRGVAGATVGCHTCDLPRPGEPSATRIGPAANGRLWRHGDGRARRRARAIRQGSGRCRLFTLAESLGGVESLIEHPALMTHALLPAERRAALGIEDGLVRLSVGVENLDDLIDDLDQVLR